MAKPRILGGIAKGQILHTPPRGTRPSPSRLREALFDILSFRSRGSFLDLYSGSGAFGLEAASRGFQVTCVEIRSEAVRVIWQNAQRLGLSVRCIRQDALKFVRSSEERFDILVASPPYPLDLEPLFQQILVSGVVEAGGVYIFQHPTQLMLSLDLPDTTSKTVRKKYGSNSLTLVYV
ncbi:MAG: RsmD family RNA methyltransferase [Trueperaceae bacterium]|nr:MAG: RsmD family RNA methyltransferase [Trueperaceae bacterium]